MRDELFYTFGYSADLDIRLVNRKCPRVEKKTSHWQTNLPRLSVSKRFEQRGERTRT